MGLLTKFLEEHHAKLQLITPVYGLTIKRKRLLSFIPIFSNSQLVNITRYGGAGQRFMENPQEPS